MLAAMTIVQVFLDFGYTAYSAKAIADAENNIRIIKLQTTSIMYLRFILCILASLVLFPICQVIPLLNSNIVYVSVAYIEACFTAFLPDFIFQGTENMGVITGRYVLS